MAALFEERYPNIAAWVQDGWIEIGHDSNNGSFIRVFDEGGLVWESDKPYTSIDKALADAEQAIVEWLDSN
jgi:hypothetical protein